MRYLCPLLISLVALGEELAVIMLIQAMPVIEHLVLVLITDMDRHVPPREGSGAVDRGHIGTFCARLQLPACSLVLM